MKDYLNSWAEHYRTDLTENMMPFRLKHGLDHVNGGMYTCVTATASWHSLPKETSSKALSIYRA